jgi:hypothetical protein
MLKVQALVYPGVPYILQSAFRDIRAVTLDQSLNPYFG